MTLSEPFTSTDIQYLLKRNGITQKALAEKLGVAEMTISRVIKAADGERRLISDRLMRAIAREIGIKPEVAFAAYYNWDGRRPRKSNSYKN